MRFKYKLTKWEGQINLTKWIWLNHYKLQIHVKKVKLSQWNQRNHNDVTISFIDQCSNSWASAHNQIKTI